MVGEIEAVFGTLFHQLHTFSPASDNLVEAEVGGLVALVRAVEYSAVDECSMIVAAHGVGGFGAASGTFVQHLVLQSARGDGDFRTLGIFGKEAFAFALGGSTLFFF